MKKILILCLCLLIGGWYSTTDHFKMLNVQSVTLNDSVVLKNEIKDLLLNLESLESFEAIDGNEYTLKINRYTGDEIYQVFLDYDFDYIVLEKEGQYYQSSYSTDYFYNNEVTSDLFDYIYYRNHEITLDKPINHGKKTLKYLFSDSNWHEITETYGSQEMIELSEETELSVNSYGGVTTMRLNGEVIDTFKLPQKNGVYELMISTVWEDSLFTGSDESYIEFTVNRPMEASLLKSTIEQGEINILTVKNSDIMPTITTSYMEGLYFNQIDDVYECIIPSSYSTTPGEYTLTIKRGDETKTLTFEVIDRVFRIQYLTVNSSTVASTQTNEGYAQYNKFFLPALLKDVYQTDHVSFILPTEGRLTTEFGENRYVNNKKTSYNHAGWDIANAGGTDIFAAADGEVVLSMPLIVTGNSIVISHGKGLFTTYFHLNDLIANEGEIVKQGDLIGKMGTTGFSTGNHLHFAISYYRMNLEPGYFIYDIKITKENYKEFFNQ